MILNVTHYIEETSDFDVDWSSVLEADERIIKATWDWDHDVSGTLRVGHSFTDTIAHVDVRGGIQGCQVLLTNRIKTSGKKHHVARYRMNCVRRYPRTEDAP